MFRTSGHFDKISFERKTAAAVEAPAEASMIYRVRVIVSFVKSYEPLLT